MGFRKRWINFFHRAATDTKNTRTLLTPIGLTIFGAFTALFVIAAIIVDRLPGVARTSAGECTRLSVSIPMMAVGIAVTTWSAFHFLKVKGTPVPFNPPPKVVNTGPYRKHKKLQCWKTYDAMYNIESRLQFMIFQVIKR